jgi:aspartate racemase
MTKHIGIVACSAEGAALCYRTICVEGAAIMGPHAHPEVSMHTHSLAKYMEFIRRNEWKGVADLMLDSAQKLKTCGAELLICPDNTIHRAFADVEKRSPLPWLHIAREVAKEAESREFRKLAITGTRPLMESSVYPDVLKEFGIEWVIPSALDRGRIDQIIFDELVYGVLRSESQEVFRLVIERMKSEGCDAVVLGCTEIPLLVSPERSPLPTLDSTRILARSALREDTEGGLPLSEKSE